MKLLDQENLEWVSSQLCRASKRYTIDARLESYSCKMVSEEKRQYKELLARLCGADKQDPPAQRLGPSQTLRSLWDLTGQPVDPLTYQLSSYQDQSNQMYTSVSSNAHAASGTVGRKRARSDTASSSDDSLPVSGSPKQKSSTSSLLTKDLFCLMSTLNSCFGPTYDFLAARSDEFCMEPELWLVKHYISRFCSIYVDKYEDLAPALWNVIDEEIAPHQCIIYSYRPDRLSDPYSSGCLASFNFFFHNRYLKRVLFFSLRVLNDPLVPDDFEDAMQDLF